MFLKTIKHNSVTTRKVGRDMAAYTSWSDRVCQQLGALFVDSAAIDLLKITNKAGTNWVCGSWMYLPKTALQIFHSVSGNVKSKHLKPPFLCLSGISCEVKCTVRERKLQTFLLIKALATSHYQNGTFTGFDKSFIPLPPRSCIYHEHNHFIS